MLKAGKKDNKKKKKAAAKGGGGGVKGGKGLLAGKKTINRGGKTYQQSSQRKYENEANASIRNMNEVQMQDSQGMINEGMDQYRKDSQNPLDFSQYTQAGEADLAKQNDFYKQNPLDMQNNVTNQMYQNQMKLMQPQMQQQREDFEQMAAERGWTPGSEVYNRQNQQFSDNQSRQQQMAMNEAFGMGNQYLNTQNDIYGTGFNQQRNMMEDKIALGDNQLKWDQAQRYQGLNDIAQVNAAMNPQYGQYGVTQQQPFQEHLTNLEGKYGLQKANIGAAATTGAASISGNAMQNSASIGANASMQNNALDNASAMERLQYQQQSGMRG